MFNFNINFRRVFLDNLMMSLRNPRRLVELKAMARPLVIMYNEFTVVRKDLMYKASFNGSVIYLRTALNDRFDPINRGIVITDPSYVKVYVYGREELQTNPILYARHDTTTNFVSGSFCVKDNVVYQSNTTPNINKTPGVDPEWDVTTRQVPFIRGRENYSGLITISVDVPSSVSFSEIEMRALIKYFKMAGVGYQIRIV